MTRPRLLDLFCGAGGAGVGYARAGFEVVGVDIHPMPRYPFEFHQGDAMTWPLEGFDVVHASPPCHAHTPLNGVNRIDYQTGWMLPAMLDRLHAWGGPFVVENVEGARAHMGTNILKLCGSEFGLDAPFRDRRAYLRRHRLFESNVWLWGAGGCVCSGRLTIGVYGGAQTVGGKPNRGKPGWTTTKAMASTAMGIDWMTLDELDESIPPAYTEFIGEQLMAHLAAVP